MAGSGGLGDSGRHGSGGADCKGRRESARNGRRPRRRGRRIAGYAGRAGPGAVRREDTMEILRTLFRIGAALVRYTGQFLLALARLYRLAWRIRRNTAGWKDLPAQSGPAVPLPS